MAEEINYWSDLEGICPVNLKRIERYSKDFNSYLPEKINLDNINKSKEDLFNARASLDSMIITLIQLLYDRNILEQETDKILFAWLIDNFGRFIRRLDEHEDHLLIKFDEPGKDSRVGISRISSYSKILKTASNSLIFESLLKSTEEYNNFKETEQLKRTPRIFLYILFQVLQVSLSVLGGLTREKTGMSKRGVVHTIPTSWQSLMTPKGQEFIREGYKEDTGVDVSEFDKDLSELSEPLVEGDIEDE